MAANGTWFGFPCESFTFEGKDALIVFPETPDEKRNWTLKMEYRDAYPETELALLKKGFHAAFLTNRTRWATRDDCDAKDRFCAYLQEHYGLRDRCVPVGMSCGGAHAVNFAGFYPERVACMFIDAPVLDFIDLPGRHGSPSCEHIWETEFTEAYPGISRVGLFSFDNHPIGKAPVLTEHRIPIVLCHGTEDITVDYNRHGRLLYEAYADAGLSRYFLDLPREYEGHHPHGFPGDPTPIVDFILKFCR
ncbi:MAG: alpha/beta hydrolase [Clostridia bacterium]|nr:alpha/beta hydrolase [Clostridia bacterium]